MTASIAEVQGLCQDSLAFLSTQFLGSANVWDTIHDDMEKFRCRPSQSKMMLVPRNTLKSTIITIDGTIQEILRNPNIRILIVNQIWDQSRKFLTEIKAKLETSDLPKIFGEFKSDKWNEDEIIVRQRTRALKEPTIATTGVEAETTGGHYDLIIFDDLMGEKNYLTPEGRAKAIRFYQSTHNLLEPGTGRRMVIGTRWHMADVYQHILDHEKDYYDVMVRKIIENGEHLFPKKFNRTFDVATKTWIPANGVSMDFINFLKKSLTPGMWSSQYLNQPIAEEDQKFRKEYFKYWDKRPAGLFVSLTVDSAIGQKKESDFTAINVTGMTDDQQLYVMDKQKGHWKISEIIENIITMYLKWKPDVVAMEDNGFQIAIKEGLEAAMRAKGIYIAVQGLTHGSDRSKEMRIEALEPFYRSGLVHHANWMRDSDFEMELLSFPKGAHDDEIDALSMQLEVLCPGDGAFIDNEPKPGTMEWEARECDRSASVMSVDAFFRDLIPKDTL